MIKESIKINNLELKNRIVMPPIATYQSTDDGKVTEKLLEYYGARAAGGNIGMITTEHSYITQQGKAKPRQLSIAEDSDVEGLKGLTSACQQNGTKVFAQINHAGSAALSTVTGLKTVSASRVIHPTFSGRDDAELPAELTKDEIEEIVKAFAAAAGRAKAAGYDGVEIHSAHSYLLNQFYSPLTNKREDEYGGTLENRIRIHLQVIEAVRAEVGSDYPISIRLGGCDYMEGGSTIADAAEASKAFEAAGVDMISLSGGMCGYVVEGRDYPGYFKDMSFAVKKVVNIPVLLTGGIKTGEDVEALLGEGAGDLIGVGRELMKNANWADELKL